MLIGRFDGADGMKTGFICASGFNQVSSATRNGRSVVSVVLGEDSLGARADAIGPAPAEGPDGKRGPGKPALGQIAPYGEGRDVVTDVSKRDLLEGAAKVRSEGRDEAGRQKLLSPFIHEINTAAEARPCRSHPRQRQGRRGQGPDGRRARRRRQRAGPRAAARLLIGPTMSPVATAVPVSILTGFLGAGKPRFSTAC